MRREPRFARRSEVWRRAEDRAADHLRACGFEVLERNWSDGLGELDIIALDGEVLVFVEVRGVQSAGWLAPERTVDFRKQVRVWKAAQRWLARCPGAAQRFYVRFDVIGVVVGSDELRHFQRAFTVDDVRGNLR